MRLPSRKSLQSSFAGRTAVGDTRSSDDRGEDGGASAGGTRVANVAGGATLQGQFADDPGSGAIALYVLTGTQSICTTIS